MSSQTASGVDLSLHNRGVYRSQSYLIQLKVCESRKKANCRLVDVSPMDTLTQLKENIVYDLKLSVQSSKISLEIYDETIRKWKKIDNRLSSSTIRDLRMSADSTLSVEYDPDDIRRDNQLSSSTTARNAEHEFTFQLCVQHKDISNSSYLNVPANCTLGKLRRQAYEKLNKLAIDRPIYRLDNHLWVQFTSDMDHRSLTELRFQSYTFICLDHDENNYTSGPPAGLRGLANLGSTCFMNSVFQCLSNAPEFTEKILALGDHIDAPILAGYIQLMKQMWSEKSTDIEPNELVTSIGDCLPTYTTYRQQDAQEFMNHFLHLIHGELSQKETLITELFYGHIRSTVKCLTCQKPEITNESISFLPVPISDYDVRTILYLKADGDQCLVSISIDSSVRLIRDLTDNFIKQYDQKLTSDRIKVVQLKDYRTIKSLDTWTYLTEVPDNELAIIERPERRNNQEYIRCDFIDHSSRQLFRPSIILVGSYYNCRSSHLTEQIDQILGHLCSITGASFSHCHVIWGDRDEKERKLNIVDNVDEDLPYIKYIVIKLDSVWADIYKAQYDSNSSASNSGLCRLLDDFFDEAPLDGDYQCLKCSQRTKAKQKSDLILPLPRVLIIQLKRFTYNDHSREKIDTLISFPLQGLDLKKYLLEDKSQKSPASSSTTYDLVAVSNHSGSMSYGHYTTYAKNKQDQNWYSFDDRYVRKLRDPSDIITKNAYILVYIQNNG